MTEFVEVKTAELIGAALEYSVAMALDAHGQETGSSTLSDSKHWVIPGFAPMRWDDWTPSTDWSQGGPLIERYMVACDYGRPLADGEKPLWFAQVWKPYGGMHGDTPLIAACRAIVAANLGETALVPVELTK